MLNLGVLNEWLVPALEEIVNRADVNELDPSEPMLEPKVTLYPSDVTAFLSAILPVIASAVLEDAADDVDTMEEVPDVSGGQWLRQRAERWRTEGGSLEIVRSDPST